MVALLPRLRRFAGSLAGAGSDADDLVQATCERALRALDTWMPGTRLDSWMFRIMHNLWIDTIRGRKPAAPLDGIPDIAGDDGRRTVEAGSELAAAGRIIAALPEAQRAVLVLTCVEELSYRDAAEVLGVPIGTVMSRLARARQTLMEEMNRVPAERASRDATGVP